MHAKTRFSRCRSLRFAKMPTTLETQKRLASRILKCGVTRVWIEPEAANEVATAMTAGDVRKFIGLGFIKERPVKGNSSGRLKHRHAQVAKGRRRGHGSRQGKQGARSNKKDRWIRQIRAQRKLLNELRDDKILTREQFRSYYAQLKPGTFKSKAYVLTYLKEQGIKLSQGKK